MEKRKFYIVDVFAEKKYAGNQLAVVRNAKFLSKDSMQRIAREMNFSETTFILTNKERGGSYDVRIFTPKKEVPFAGHPTLGTGFIIQSKIVKKCVKEIILNLKVGKIPVSFSYKRKRADVLWMKQRKPTFGKVIDPSQIARILNLDLEDLDTAFPVQEVSTGLPFFIVPLRTLRALKKCKLNQEKFFELIKETEAKLILIFSPETYSPQNQLNVRVFADYVGVPEDPATGSANGCLAGYLVYYRYFGKNRINIRLEQGYEIGRPSLLLLRAEEKDGKIDVFVGGKVIMVAQGELS